MENHPVISIHEYELKPSAEGAQFERAFKEAEARGLFELPGLLQYHFVKGIRGARKYKYAVIWIYENKKAWEQLWGPVDQPIPKSKYPDKWLTWEAGPGCNQLHILSCSLTIENACQHKV